MKNIAKHVNNAVKWRWEPLLIGALGQKVEDCARRDLHIAVQNSVDRNVRSFVADRLKWSLP